MIGKYFVKRLTVEIFIHTKQDKTKFIRGFFVFEIQLKIAF